MGIKRDLNLLPNSFGRVRFMEGSVHIGILCVERKGCWPPLLKTVCGERILDIDFLQHDMKDITVFSFYILPFSHTNAGNISRLVKGRAVPTVGDGRLCQRLGLFLTILVVAFN